MLNLAIFFLAVLFVLFIFRYHIKARFLIWIGLMASLNKGKDSVSEFVQRIVKYQPKPGGKKFFLRQLKYLEEKIPKIQLQKDDADFLLETIRKRKSELTAC